MVLSRTCVHPQSQSAKERMDRPLGDERENSAFKLNLVSWRLGRRGWGCAEMGDGTGLAFGLLVEACKELIYFTEMGIENGSC